MGTAAVLTKIVQQQRTEIAELTQRLDRVEALLATLAPSDTKDR